MNLNFDDTQMDLMNFLQNEPGTLMNSEQYQELIRTNNEGNELHENGNDITFSSNEVFDNSRNIMDTQDNVNFPNFVAQPSLSPNSSISQTGDTNRNSLSSFSPLTQVSDKSPPNQSGTTIKNETITLKNPASKKKAQNRAAQKAFRDRKEARLKELETKLNESEYNRQTLLEEVETLRKLNMEINAENRTLLMKNVNDGQSTGNNNQITSIEKDLSLSSPPAKTKFSFPTMEIFIEDIVKDLPSEDPELVLVDKTYNDNSGNVLLTVPATWEYLSSIDNPELDVTYVLKRLRGHERCHGNGPAYTKTFIDSVIQDARDT